MNSEIKFSENIFDNSIMEIWKRQDVVKSVSKLNEFNHLFFLNQNNNLDDIFQYWLFISPAECIALVPEPKHTGRLDSKFSHIFKSNTKFELLY